MLRRRLRPNPAVNADAPVRPFNLASRGGGAPVTLIVSLHNVPPGDLDVATKRSYTASRVLVG